MVEVPVFSWISQGASTSMNFPTNTFFPFDDLLLKGQWWTLWGIKRCSSNLNVCKNGWFSPKKYFCYIGDIGSATVISIKRQVIHIIRHTGKNGIVLWLHPALRNCFSTMGGFLAIPMNYNILVRAPPNLPKRYRHEEPFFLCSNNFL